MVFRWIVVALWGVTVTAGCGREALWDASTPDSASSEAGPVPDLVDRDADAGPAPDVFDGNPACMEHAATSLDCVLDEVRCLTPNPCPTTWSAAQTTCPLDGQMTLATTCDFRRWSFHPLDPQAADVYCFYDPLTGALRTIRQTMLRNAYCGNASYQRWTGPDLENCDRTSFNDPSTTSCPRSVQLPPCPPDAVPGVGCSPSLGSTGECARPDGSSCTCHYVPPGDDFSWQCSG
jgi:hypothetical protein